MAYITTHARYKHNGLFTDIEPGYKIHPTQSELVPIVKELLSKRVDVLSDPTPIEIKKRRDLLPRVTGARSWKRLCKNGISYIIELSNQGFLLEMSRLDKKDRWEFDPDKIKTYPRNTDIAVIIQDVLEDLAERSRAKNEEGTRN
jgi:hypothetical protein